ncbi:MAG: Gx transporter family protein [Candidatus Cloacimonetes bacterium]|mgnify:FL=1|jgi:heptaprenyl diphosphate synthase|nr:Gx transporter family protein [Candidatus Cloacimonadota bacterium]MBT6994597.1 Gx transporter family protein [Candidatus Cloacimonadota bacterium]
MIEQKHDFNRLTKIAFFTALAISIYILEMLIPKPFPFVKVGFANIIILILLASNGAKIAFLVTIGKTIMGGFLTGTIFTPTTIISLTSGIIALFVMSIVFKTKISFSFIGVSILGAIAHNFTQILVVRILLIKENSIFYLTPILIILGIITGIITGYLAILFYEKNKLSLE